MYSNFFQGLMYRAYTIGLNILGILGCPIKKQQKRQANLLGNLIIINFCVKYEKQNVITLELLVDATSYKLLCLAHWLNNKLITK
jgi:hypothetical protein